MMLRGQRMDRKPPVSTRRDMQMESEFEALHRRNLELSREVDRLSALREVALTVSGSLELK